MMYSAASDRDYAEETHLDNPSLKRVPCAICRRAVRVDARTYSIFQRSLCEQCAAEDYATNGQDVRR